MHGEDGEDEVSGMKATQNARERARAQLTLEIKEEARRQVAAGGAQQLSLRAVARELGMVSSALYRYYPSRDELLTALIIDAYDSLGAAAEAAVAGAGATGAGVTGATAGVGVTEAAVGAGVIGEVAGVGVTGTATGTGVTGAVAGAGVAEAAVAGADSVRERWRAGCRAVRDWAKARPHEYALIYGSPVPGYEAPQQTVAPASRIPVVLGGLLAEAWKDQPADNQAEPDRPGGHVPVALPGRLAAQAQIVAAAIAPEVPPPVIANALIAWTQLFGMISFELFGQLVGSADPADDFFAYAVEQMADLVGLPD
jgi:AcrR family transcriptional regulator